MQPETMKAALAPTTVEHYPDKFDIEVPIEEDIKRAWRQGLTAKHISNRYGGSVGYIRNLCKNTKRKNDINKNNIFIVKDHSKNKPKPYIKKD